MAALGVLALRSVCRLFYQAPYFILAIFQKAKYRIEVKKRYGLEWPYHESDYNDARERFERTNDGSCSWPFKSREEVTVPLTRLLE